jgi:class 3 adenylate cyclase
MTATRRLAAILAADVAGYSRLMGALGGFVRRRRDLAFPDIKTS